MGSTCSRPWHEPFEGNGNEGTTVVEGFPGLPLRNLGIIASGYKGPTEDRRLKRLHILSRLLQEGLPIAEDDRLRIVEDADGDALDALLLLVSAAKVAARPREDWIRKKSELQEKHAEIEGWFFD